MSMLCKLPLHLFQHIANLYFDVTLMEGITDDHNALSSRLAIYTSIDYI